MYHRFLIAALLLLYTSTVAPAAAPPSSINLIVASSTSELASVINRTLPHELYRGDGGFGTSVRVLRNGAVGVSTADNFVQLSLPVQLVFSNALYESYPLKAGLRFKVKVSVASEWRLKTELYYTGLADALVDSLRLGPISLKPKGMVEAVTQPLQKLLAPVVDSRINDAVRLREKVGALWQSTFNPKLVSKEYGAWLKLSPERIVMSPLLVANDQIRVSIGIVTGAELSIGPQPAAVPVRPLPPLQTVATFDRRFLLQLPVELVFSDLVAALTPVLQDKSFGDERQVTVKRFDLKGEDGRLVVVMTTTGDYDGELTVVARPVHDPEQNTLTFAEVDFDTRNAGWLVTTGSWLFNSSIRSAIRSKLDAALAAQLEKARQKGASALASVQLAEHVTLTGDIKSLTLGEATVHSDRLTLRVVAQGESNVRIK